MDPKSRNFAAISSSTIVGINLSGFVLWSDSSYLLVCYWQTCFLYCPYSSSFAPFSIDFAAKLLGNCREQSTSLDFDTDNWMIADCEMSREPDRSDLAGPHCYLWF
jgi:hypothetical protein